MKRLGEILVARGKISMEELRSALQACQTSGTRLGSQLLKLNFISEADLLEVLADQHGVPCVTEVQIEAASEAIRDLIPREMQLRYKVIPFAQARSGVIDLAMASPSDVFAIGDVMDHTSNKVRPHLTSEASILKILHRQSGTVEPEPVTEFEIERLSDPKAQEQPRHKRPGTGPMSPMSGQIAVQLSGFKTTGARSLSSADVAIWKAMWLAPRVEPMDLRTIGDVRSPVPTELAFATFPALEEVSDVGRDRSSPLSRDELMGRLKEVRHQSEIGALLTRFVARSFERCAVFKVSRGRAVGWVGRGPDLVVDDLQTVSIPLDQPSVFASIASGGAYFLGPLVGSEQNEMLRLALGAPPVDTALVVPVRVRDRAVLMLLADNSGKAIDASVAPQLVDALARISLAFEMVILRSKIK